MRRPATVSLPLLAVVIFSVSFAVQAKSERVFDPLKNADSRIRQIRMREVEIRLTDKQGEPARGIKVRAAMQRHQFLFGCNLYLFGRFKSADQNEQYLKLWSGLFNYATVPFYFAEYEPEPGNTREKQLREMVEWCRARNITVKGHPLIWHESSGNPGWIPREPESLEPVLKKRIENLVTTFPQIKYWDLINEPTTSWRNDSPVALWINKIGPVAAAERAGAWIRSANPEARFLINDYNVWSIIGAGLVIFNPARAIKMWHDPVKHFPVSYFQYLEALKEKKIAPDAIGIQSHLQMGNWPIIGFWYLCESYSKLGLPLHFTEITVLSGKSRKVVHYFNPGKNSAWPTTPKGERAQADYVGKMYTVLFSHPAVEAITWWDFSDKDAWLNAPAGLMRDDLTRKPAYDELQRLIRQKWWTNFEGETGQEGELKFRGFCGDYLLEISGHDPVPFSIDCQKAEAQVVELKAL